MDSSNLLGHTSEFSHTAKATVELVVSASSGCSQVGGTLWHVGDLSSKHTTGSSFSSGNSGLASCFPIPLVSESHLDILCTSQMYGCDLSLKLWCAILTHVPGSLNGHLAHLLHL